MDQLRSLMQSALAQRLGEHLRAEVSPLTNLPNVQGQSLPQRAVSGLRLGTMLPRDLLDTLGLAREAVDYGTKALTGGIAQEVGGIQQIDNPVLRNAANATSFLLPGGPATALTALLGEAGRLGLPSPFGPSDFKNAMQAGADNRGNFISNARAANEGLARESPLATGLLNQLVNPLSYVTGGGTEEARAAQQAGRIASGLGLDLGTVTNILYPEGQIAHTVGSALVGAAAPKVAGVLGDKLTGDILQRRYGLPAPPIPGVTADAAQMAAKPAANATDRAAQLLAALHDVNGPVLPPEFGPAFPNQRGNLPLDQMIPGIGNGKPSGIGPLLPALQDVPLPPEQGPTLPLGGNVPPDQLLPGIGQTGNKGTGTGRGGRPGIGPVLSPADLLGAGRQASDQLAQAATAAATPAPDTLGLMRDLLKSGDNGKGMVYAPADPQFWQKRVGVDPAAVPDLLRQLQNEGSLAPDQTGELLNTYLAGGPRTADRAAWQAQYVGQSQAGTDILAAGDKVAGSDVTQASMNAMSPAERMAALQKLVGGETPPVVAPSSPLAPDMPGGSLDLPAMPGYPGQTRAEAIGNLTPTEVGQLAQLAYRNPTALKYAMASHPDPVSLANAALDRITGNRTLAENLATQHPDLAGKLAYLPDFLTPQAGGQGGNSVLDWLLKSPVQGAPQVSRLGIAGSGGVIGAAAGGLAPADSEDQRRIHALQGAAVGTGLGLGAVSQTGMNILKSLPVAKEFTGNLVGAANVAQREAMDRSNKGITSFTNLANSWRVQQTSTIRNLIQDELTARLWNSNAGVRQQMMNDNWSSLVQLYNLGKTNGYDALPTQTTSLLDKWGLTGYMPNIGAGFNNVNESLIKDLSAADMAKMEAIFAGLNPAQGGVPLAGVALGAVKGYTRAWQEKIFSTLNEFTRLAARHAAFQDEFAPAMQVAAHDFVARHGATGVLDPAAGFSAQDVGQALGQAAQDEWSAQVQKVTHLAEQRALDIHGDFTRTNVPGASKSVGDRAANLFNTAVPFSSWALKAYPRTAAMMLDHPGVSLAIMLLTMGQAEKVQREGKAGLVGGVPIDANTPLVGGIARKMLGNFPGEAYVNLLGSLTPVSTSALLSPDQPVNANLYQKAGEALDRAGFSFNPLIQAAAYASNKDFQRPSPMSRTAGLEMALPGPDMPSLALGPLNAARVAAGGSAQHTTPEDRKLAELFYMATGHQIADPTNVSDPQRAALLASTLDPNSPIRKLAAQSTGQANVARNLVSLVSPASLQAAPQVEQQAEAASYAARHAPPANYDPRTINALMNSGNMAQYIEAVMRQRANVGTQGEVSPLLQLTSQSAGQDRASMYLQALGASSIFGSPLVGAPQSLINQILGLSTPSIEIGGPQGGQR